MADAVGFLGKMGIRKVAAWDTAYSAVNDRIPFTGESLTKEWQRIQRETLGSGGRLPSESGNQVVQGSTEHEIDYANFTALFAAVMGLDTAGVVTIEDLLRTNAHYYWLEFDKQVTRWRFGPSMATKMVLSGEAGQLVKGTWDWICRDHPIPSATAFPAISPSTISKVRFEDISYFRVADQLNALAAGDNIEIGGFEVEFDRNMKTDDYTSDSGGDPEMAIEALENGFRSCKLKIKIPRYTNTTFETWKDADTALQAELYFLRSGSSIKLEFPDIRISNGFDSETGGPGIHTVEGEFECYLNDANGYMSVSEEMQITVA